MLHIETDRHIRGGVRSNARVVWHSADGGRTHAFGLGTGCGDFDCNLKHVPAARVTQQKIDAQHAEVFTSETIATIIADAKAHYAKAA